jgi:hypothetical protein
MAALQREKHSEIRPDPAALPTLADGSGDAVDT